MFFPETAQPFAFNKLASTSINSKFALGISAALLGLLSVFVFHRLVPTWYGNDDVAMMLICAGRGVCSRPDSHTLFTNILLGTVLAKLYSITNSIPWYGYYVAAVNIAGLFAITAALLINRSLLFGLTSAVLFLTIIGMRSLCFMQFTAAACMLGLGGVALILAWWESDQSAADLKLSVIWALAGTTLLIISSLVRFESFELTTILYFYIFSIRAIVLFKRHQRYSWLTVRAPLALIAISSVIALISYGINSWVYDLTPGWDEFYRANKLQANFTDFGVARNESEPRLLGTSNTVHWSTNDVEMLQNFFYFDHRLYSIKNMTVMSNALWDHHFKSTVVLWNDVKELIQNPILRPTILSCLWCLLFYRSKELPFYAVNILALALIGLMSVLMIGFKLPQHVYVPIFTFFFYIVLFYFNREISPDLKSRNARQVRRASLTLGVLLIAVTSNHVYRECRSNSNLGKRNNLVFKHAVAELQLAGSHNLYLPWREYLRYECILPFDSSAKYLENFDLLPLGFRANQPLATSMMKKHEISIENFGRSVLRRDVFLISSPELNLLMSTYLFEHYGLKIEFSPYKSYPTIGLSIFRGNSSP